MTQRTKRTPRTNDTFPIDAQTIGVRLQDGPPVMMSRADFEALQGAGHVGRLCWNVTTPGIPGYVRMWSPVTKNLVMVARLITKALPHEAIAYRNGDRLDLRRANLVRVPRVGYRKSMPETAKEYFPGDPAAQAAWLKGHAQARKAARTSRATQEGPRHVA